MLINGSPFLFALADGAFDGASVQRDRVFLTAGAVVGGVTLFKGFLSTVDTVGRTMAKVTMASRLVLLDYPMPHNIFGPTCNHTLYDSGCGVVASSYVTAGTVGSGSTASLILSSGARALHTQGSLVFTSGVNSGIRATVKSVVVGTSLTLIYPVPAIPMPGDNFNVYAGCDHTQATCVARFANLANFRGFPFVPPVEISV